MTSLRALITSGLVAGGLLLGAGAAAAQPPQPIESLDLNRYLGTWHQLAAIPQPFNLVCARDTTATYGLVDAGTVSVFNRCTTWINTPNEIRGTAKVTDPATNAQLRVNFPNSLSPDSPDGPPNYVVTAIGDDYEWALVTNPQRTSGFVLSRTPALSASQWSDVEDAIAAAGYNGCVFLTSPTTGGREDITPLCPAGSGSA